MPDRENDRFFARWSRRKALAREGIVAPEPAPASATPRSVAPAAAAPAGTPPAQTVPAPPPPTLDDVAALAPGANVSRFVAPGVDTAVRNAALKRLFADPRFNVMDGLDTYIDDYGRPDPLPVAMLRRMAQASLLGVLDQREQPALQPPAPPAPMHEDPDLRLQPHDAAGPPGTDPGSGSDPGRER